MTVVQPSLTLNFAQSGGMFDPRVRCTRACTATYFGQGGLMKTEFTNQPRIDFDPATGECLGLLVEEERTNAVTSSEQFENWFKPAAPTAATVTANSTTAPDGNTTADTIHFHLSTDHPVYNWYNITSGTGYYTNSVFIKKPASGGLDTVKIALNIGGGTAIDTYVLYTFSTDTVTSTGSTPFAFGRELGAAGWVRAWISAQDNNSGNNSIRHSIGCNGVAGDVYAWGAQSEAGAFPTSYIPTTTAGVTRLRDQLWLETSGFSYNAGESTIMIDGSFAVFDATNAYMVALHDGSASQLAGILRMGGALNHNVQVGASTEVLSSLGTIAAGQAMKIAAGWQVNDDAAVRDGGTPVVDTFLPSLPAPATTLQIGARNDGSETMSGHIRYLAYYPRKLSNTEIQEMTV